MSNSALPPSPWLGTLRSFFHPRVITFLFLGLSAGLPLLLIFSSLSLWLREAGIERAAVTYFSWAALGYSFKFVWAPLVDQLPLPILTRFLGRRRGWLLLSQLMIILAIISMALIDPATDTATAMAWAAVILGFSAATQDIVIDAYRIESAEPELQALMASSYIIGYRVGMIVAGAGALFLADYLGSTAAHYDYLAWQKTYFIMAGMMLVGVITTCVITEPRPNKPVSPLPVDQHYLGFLALFCLSILGFIASFYFSATIADYLKDGLVNWVKNKYLASFIIEFIRLGFAIICAGVVAQIVMMLGMVPRSYINKTYIAPVSDFFQRYGGALAWLLLALIGLYRISDIMLGVISNVFYQDLGFSKPVIAKVVKTFGLIMTLVGGVFGGLLAMRYGVMKILFLGALLSAITNLLFMLLAQVGHDVTLLYIVISADNISAGIASAAFIAFLSQLTNISFTAMQYAIFSSLMTLLPKILGGYSGAMVDVMGYQSFFLVTALVGLPVLILIIWTRNVFEVKSKPAD